MVNTFGGDWTRSKLEILERYLDAYTTALKNQPFRLWYVDAFAGTGYIKLDSGDVAQGKLLMSENGWDSETADVLKGSVRRAIEIDDRPFDSLIFVELNFEYASELSKIKHEYKERNIQIVPQDANNYLQNWCLSQNRKLGIPWNNERAVIFLDPFATEVDWQTVQRISETKSVDLWILFPLSALTRMLPTDRQPDDANIANLNRVFGGPEWQDVYTAQAQPTLFGAETQIVRDDQQAIVDLYLSKLREVFPAVVNKPKWFRNSRNSPLFAFMFAAANPGRGGRIALNIANHLIDRW